MYNNIALLITKIQEQYIYDWYDISKSVIVVESTWW